MRMQLENQRGPSALRNRLGAAACLLLTAAMPAPAKGDATADAKWQFDGSGLLYAEKGRTRVVEPIARITRLFAGGQSLSAQLALDAITGASPSGALPSGRVQTTTTPSGNVRTIAADQIPTSSFSDARGALDVEWLTPLGGHYTSTTGAHFSREKDYQSVGGNARFAVETMQRLTTLTVGAGYNRDTVIPTGGIPIGLSDGNSTAGVSSEAKRVTSGMAGVSRILTRRWMIGVNVSRSIERGYLTEPYKVVSLLNPLYGTADGELTEKRPSSRARMDVLTSSVYHLTDDVLYLSHRYYWDDWKVRSHTIDVKYRHELENQAFVQPHVRFYRQTPADFYKLGLIKGSVLPAYATSDYRIGPLRTLTVGATYGFHVQNYPGDWSIRGELIRQWGDNHPSDAIGAQRDFNQFPALNIGSVVVTYTLRF
jgi:hypothetical protein